MKWINKILFSLAVLLLSLTHASAFNIDGSKWPTGEIEFYVGMNGTSASGITWNAAFIAAMNDWNTQTPFNFLLRGESRDPCVIDYLNSVAFSDDLCGSAFGSNTLAVTLVRYQSTILGKPIFVEADIIVDQNENLDIYDGRILNFGRKALDFRRIALHELGHAIGLEHESDNAAIMAPTISNLDRLQADDIAGAEKLYDGTINCVVNELVLGSFSNALDANDCKVSELLYGSSDTSPIDLYRFELTSSATLSLGMTSSTLDSVLLIADKDLQVISFDDKTSNGCNSSLTQFLVPGNYFLLANTYDKPVKSECGNFGEYKIDAVLSSEELTSLGLSSSLGGATANATFMGGITSNDGASYTNQFAPSASLDISMRIDIDSEHVGQAGFLVIAAAVGEQVLFLNEQGQFVDSAANPGVIIRATSKVLSSVEELMVVENLVPASLGISEMKVEFYFGYGINSDLNDLYYHLTPLNLIIGY